VTSRLWAIRHNAQSVSPPIRSVVRCRTGSLLRNAHIAEDFRWWLNDRAFLDNAQGESRVPAHSEQGIRRPLMRAGQPKRRR
jgi:hypothetical protein